MPCFTENTIEEFTIGLLQKQGFEYIHAPGIAYDGIAPARYIYKEVFPAQ